MWKLNLKQQKQKRMKKIISIFCLVVLCYAAKAQTAFSQTATNPTGAILNTSVDTMVLVMSGGYNAAVGIQPVITRATGTMAGTAILYGSINGTNYVATGDTLTLTNAATNTTIWTKSQPIYKYFRILVGGATTVTGTASAKALGIKPN